MSDNLSVSLQNPATGTAAMQTAYTDDAGATTVRGTMMPSDVYNNEITIMGGATGATSDCGMSSFNSFLETISGMMSQLIALVRDLARPGTTNQAPATPSTGTTTPKPLPPATTTNPTTGTTPTTLPTTGTPSTTPTTSTTPASTSTGESSMIKELLAGFNAMFDKLMDRIAKLEKKIKKLSGGKKGKKAKQSSSTNSTQTQSSGGTTATQNTIALRNTGLNAGFLWKPISDSDGKLAILLPPGLSGNVASVSVIGADGKQVEGRFSGAGNPVNGADREHYRFNQSGSEFGGAAKVLITLKDGSTKEIEIADTGSRNET